MAFSPFPRSSFPPPSPPSPPLSPPFVPCWPLAELHLTYLPAVPQLSVLRWPLIPTHGDVLAERRCAVLELTLHRPAVTGTATRWEEELGGEGGGRLTTRLQTVLKHKENSGGTRGSVLMAGRGLIKRISTVLGHTHHRPAVIGAAIARQGEWWNRERRWRGMLHTSTVLKNKLHCAAVIGAAIAGQGEWWKQTVGANCTSICTQQSHRLPQPTHPHTPHTPQEHLSLPPPFPSPASPAIGASSSLVNATDCLSPHLPTHPTHSAPSPLPPFP